ncbi:HD domain-containing protein [Pendulispora albinea]|uniref:HD domain-containing protein n=1 Tax=Pendulispora albinea TaxID=2741071 RepID=A0ABZ2M784_9BACT
MSSSIAGISIPDSKLAREATELVRDCSTPLLFHHSTRVYFFGALTGANKGLTFDPELLYVGAMFHDLGLTKRYASTSERFEVDGANAAANFLRAHGLADGAIEVVWDAIALHTTPGIPQHKKPEVALVTAGVEMDVLGLGFPNVSPEARARVVEAHPRGASFKEDILRAFFEGIHRKPNTTFGNVKADVLARMDPNYARVDFCEVILSSAWPS